MKRVNISYNPSAVPQIMIDEYSTAFADYGYNSNFVTGGLKCPLRVLPYNYNRMQNGLEYPSGAAGVVYTKPTEEDYVFSPYPALSGNINLSAKPETEILFAGRLSEPEKIKQAWLGLTGRIYKLCYITAEILETTGLHFNEAVDAALLDMNHLSPLSPEDYKYLASQIGSYISALHGFNMVKELLDAGLRVTCAGPRSYCSLSKHPNLITVKHSEPPAILLRAHPLPMYGADECILSAMGSSVVVATDSNGFITDNFIDGEDLVTFSPGFAQRIALALDNHKEIGLHAREKILNNHMPRHRVEKIVLALEISGRAEVSLFE